MQTEQSSSHWKRRVIAYLSGQTISTFGSSLVQFALTWYVNIETGSGAMYTIAMVCAFLPQIIVSLFAGVWADRYNRKTIIILADGSIALTTLLLAIAMMLGQRGMWMIFLAMAIRSVGTGIQMPAVSALLPQIVPENELMRVNGINASIMSATNLAAPALGGFLLTMGKMHHVMFIDVITAVVGMSILAAIPISTHAKALQAEQGSALEDLKQGVRYASKHSLVSQLLKMYTIFSFLIVPAVFLNPLMVTRTFGNTYANMSMNEMSFFMGTLVGGGLIAVWGGFKNRIATLAAGTIMFGLLTFAIGFIPHFGVYLVVIGITGITMPIFNTPVTVMLQEKVEPDMQGRIFSLMQILFSTCMLIGMSFYGVLADQIRIQWMMIITGALLAIFGAAMLFNKRLMREGEQQKIAAPVEAVD